MKQFLLTSILVLWYCTHCMGCFVVKLEFMSVAFKRLKAFEACAQVLIEQIIHI